MGPLPVLKPSRLMVSVDTLAKAKAAIEAGADGILFGGESYSHRVITLQDYQAVWELARQSDVRIDFNLPRIIKENHQSAIEKLLTACEKDFAPDAVHVHNIGALAMVRRLTSLPVHADYSLIAYNHETLQFLREHGVVEATLSPELNLKQIKPLA